jgi:DNA-directed RNA polymerase beta' subunit
VQEIITEAQLGKMKHQPGKKMMDSVEVLVNAELNLARDEAGSIAFKNLDPQNKI